MSRFSPTVQRIHRNPFAEGFGKELDAAIERMQPGSEYQRGEEAKRRQQRLDSDAEAKTLAGLYAGGAEDEDTYTARRDKQHEDDLAEALKAAPPGKPVPPPEALPGASRREIEEGATHEQESPGETATGPKGPPAPIRQRHERPSVTISGHKLRIPTRETEEDDLADALKGLPDIQDSERPFFTKHPEMLDDVLRARRPSSTGLSAEDRMRIDNNRAANQSRVQIALQDRRDRLARELAAMRQSGSADARAIEQKQADLHEAEVHLSIARQEDADAERYAPSDPTKQIVRESVNPEGKAAGDAAAKAARTRAAAERRRAKELAEQPRAGKDSTATTGKKTASARALELRDAARDPNDPAESARAKATLLREIRAGTLEDDLGLVKKKPAP